MSELTERRAEDKQRRRDQILDAAVAAAIEHGLSNFSMGQVARKARLSRALLYVYFHDRQDILMGLAERAHTMLAARFARIMAGNKSGLKKLQAVGRDYVEFAFEAPVYFEALCAFAAHDPVNDEQRGNALRCLESGDRINQQIEQTLKEGMADGSLRKNLGSTTLVAVTLWGFVHGVVQVLTTRGAIMEFKGIKSAELVDQAMALCTRALEKA